MSKLEYGSLCIAVDELKGKRHLLRLKEGGVLLPCMDL